MTNRSLLEQFNTWLSKEIPETEMNNPTILFERLYNDPNNNPTLEILVAYRKVEKACKGETFLAAINQSSDSYPITIKLVEIAYDNNLIEINYHGMSALNRDGNSDKAGIDNSVNVKEINWLLHNLNKKLNKKLPYAKKINNDTIMFPQISVTRK